MRYAALGAFFWAIALPFTLLGQPTKSTPKKNGARKAPITQPAPAAQISPQSILVVPNWLPPVNPVQPAATILHDLVDTKLDVKFDWAKQWLLGVATITVRPHFYPQTQLVLDAKGFDVKSVKLLAGTKEKNLNYQYDKRRLSITLDKAYARTEPYQVRIQYMAKPNELAAGGSAAITSDKGLYFINPLGTDKNKPKQIWTQGETEGSSCWFPTIDRPNQRMTQEISLTVDAQYKTLSNGLLTASKKNSDGTRTDTWKLNQPHAPYLAMLAVGDYAVINDTWRGKPVDYYVEPKYAASAKAVFGNTPQMMDFFSKKLGIDYPWDKYAQVAVRDYVSGAMENTTATIHGENVQLTKRELLDENRDDVIAHELFHQWFGDYVTTESWSNLPLNESFADYSEYLWAEFKYGREEADLQAHKKLGYYFEEAQGKREPLIRYRYADKEDMFDRHSYEKGGRVLHMLRGLIGDDAFFTTLNRYLAQNKYSAVEIAELRMAFEDVTGEDLMWFFDQWFMQRGHPDVAVSHSYADGKVTLHVVQKQDTLYQPIYRLPVVVTTWSNNQPTDHRIVVTKAAQTFQLPVNQKPSLVQFDAEKTLLADLEEEKTQDELVYQYYHARNFLSKLQAIEELKPKVGDLLVSGMLRNALNDKFWGTRRAAAEALRRYKGPEGGAVRQDLKRVAITDKDSRVRSTALLALGTFPNEDFSEVYAKALADSSYLVMGAAINALAKAPTVATREKINSLQNETNPALVTALSGYYALNGNADQYQWYLHRLDDSNSAELYQVAQDFGTFMLRMPAVERDKGLRKLEVMARTHPEYYVRLGAYHGLRTLSENMPNLKGTLADIRGKEKDERLIGIYNLLQ
ncbi:M1 family metallopeptidase [Hymenobacter busanensis]|uniref:Aminopeptidase N n=1 Tax=Hymenobacter busanensis TaxID=2607656 RepID=A0A7L5A105_9BACT|nr:M1 family metallopeptidase [Hymenobacter busanensis]KAA9338686.1 M1 family metallopeptidase [Hymenobacter busanensis]QHJ08883.1 M1 family peptidase [Hymenobacter busanensis]